MSLTYRSPVPLLVILMVCLLSEPMVTSPKSRFRDDGVTAMTGLPGFTPVPFKLTVTSPPFDLITSLSPNLPLAEGVNTTSIVLYFPLSRVFPLQSHGARVNPVLPDSRVML